MADFKDPEPLKKKRTESQAQYNRRYYLRHKDRIKKQRDARYQHDEEYKQGILRRRAKQREFEKKERRRAKEKALPKNQRGPKRMRVTLPDGTKHITGMFTLGQAAYLIGVSGQTIRKWESQGVLPPTTYRTTGKHRLYTVHQVEVIQRVFVKYRKLQKVRWRLTDDFRGELAAALGELTQGIRLEEEEDE